MKCFSFNLNGINVLYCDSEVQGEQTWAGEYIKHIFLQRELANVKRTINPKYSQPIYD